MNFLKVQRKIIKMKKPKIRIKKVFEQVVENGGAGIGKIMIKNGYSPNTAKTPQKITESKSWEMLLDQYIPESLVLKTHKKAFKANRVISARTTGKADEKTDDFIDVPDWQTRTKAVELGYKVRGKLINKFEGQIKNIDSELNKLETDYDKFSKEIKEQTVEDDTSLQDKG